MEFAELSHVPNSPLLSKMATNDGHGENSSYFDGWKAYDCDPFHPTDNPEGVIQMGISENQAIAQFMRKVKGGKINFDRDRIVMSGGATQAVEILAFYLADPGETFFVPMLYYPAYVL